MGGGTRGGRARSPAIVGVHLNLVVAAKPTFNGAAIDAGKAGAVADAVAAAFDRLEARAAAARTTAAKVALEGLFPLVDGLQVPPPAIEKMLLWEVAVPTGEELTGKKGWWVNAGV